MAAVTIPRRILITGGSGQVGGALQEELAHLGQIYAPGRSELDLSNGESIRRVMREFKPEWVVNAGAYTAVDKAESERELASAINATAPAIVAEEAKTIGGVVIHFSTDYVFDGLKTTPYVESDPTGPVNIYGSSKLAGELALEASGVPHMIFRTSWVYGAAGKNFLLSILKFAREREELRIVADQHGAPTWSAELARMTAHVIADRESVVTRGECSLAEAVAPVSGVYHASGSGETTWYGFAEEAIQNLRAIEPATKLASVKPIPTVDYPTPAKRPLNSRMDCAKLEKTLGWRMPAWQDSVAKVVASLPR